MWGLRLGTAGLGFCKRSRLVALWFERGRKPAVFEIWSDAYSVVNHRRIFVGRWCAFIDGVVLACLGPGRARRDLGDPGAPSLIVRGGSDLSQERVGNNSR